MRKEAFQSPRTALDPDQEAVATPPIFMVFDLMYRDGRDLSARPLGGRRA
jgi:ATP-dependent DNA ligase